LSVFVIIAENSKTIFGPFYYLLKPVSFIKP
jgi:hypothetical protein